MEAQRISFFLHRSVLRLFEPTCRSYRKRSNSSRIRSEFDIKVYRIRRILHIPPIECHEAELIWVGDLFFLTWNSTNQTFSHTEYLMWGFSSLETLSIVFFLCPQYLESEFVTWSSSTLHRLFQWQSSELVFYWSSCNQANFANMRTSNKYAAHSLKIVVTAWSANRLGTARV